MNRRLILAAVLLLTTLLSAVSHAEAPLRVFIRAGKKSHGPGAHDYPQFLKDWVPLLNERGAKCAGGLEFPTQAQLEQTDVLVLHSQEAGDIAPADRTNLDTFLKRGGGLVVIHAAAVSHDPDWYKTIIGGSWRFGATKWLEGPMHLYFTDHENPITKDCSNWAMDDEIYYDMELLPEARIIAGAYTPKPAGTRNEKAAKRAAELTGGGKKVSIYDVQPQMWMYEKDNYRAFVSIPGHYYKNFDRPNYRAIILRGIAWAGKHTNVDELCRPNELGDNLRYVEGGPTRPEKAAAKLEVHPDFNVSLVAAEPLINKAMNVDWDEKGRMWVCETPEYPNGRRIPNTDPWKDSGSLYPYKQEREPQDRISILTDTNGDGIMDKKHVFADKLELVTSFCFYKNGVIACSAPDIWFLEDTDGDEVCDKRTKLYTGLGTGDTHAVINNLRWGYDGWIYATHGYSAGNVTSPDGSKDFGKDGAGVVRFKPDGSMFEQYSSKNSNTWGLDITWNGQVFFTQPTCGEVLMHVVLPEYVLAKGKMPGTNSYSVLLKGQKTYPLMTWPEQAYVQIDQVGAFTAAAGCAIYEGGAWPAPWNYSYFTGEPTINIVSHRFVTPDGVTYKAEKQKGREETEFIRSSDLWFRPIEERIGPDGALYIVDFYNQAVIHNDTRGPLHGPANAAVRPDRDHYFGRIWRVQHKDAKKLEVPVLDKNNFQSLANALKTSPNAHVKANAWRLLNEQAEQDHNNKGLVGLAESGISPRMTTAPLALYESLKRDLAYGQPKYTPEQKQHIEDVHKGIIASFAKADDAWTQSAIIAAASESRAMESILWSLNAPESPRIAEFVSAILNPALVPTPSASDPSGNLIFACGQASTKADSLKVIILNGIAQQTNGVAALTPSLTEALKKLLTNPTTAGPALSLVIKWDTNGALAADVKTLVASLTKKATDKAAPVESRISAAKALVSVGGEARASVVPLLADKETPQVLQAAIVESLGESGNTSDLVQAFSGLRPELRNRAFDQILKRPESFLAMLKAIEEGKVSPIDLGPGNVARLRTHPNKMVSKRAEALMEKLSPQTRQKNELIAKLAPEVEKPGNAANGKALFTAVCAVCHKLGDVGLRDVGPQLTGMGAHGPAELLVSVVDPNREVDPSFWQWNITTKKGDTLVGVITNENATSLNLRNQTGDTEIKISDIANRENTHRSLMPEGLEGLGAEALRDILAFICGGDQKFRVLDLRPAYTADTRRGLFNSEEATGDTVHFSKLGNVTAEGVPYFIMDPAKSPNGLNVIVLKGGGEKTFAHQFPQRVEIPVHTTAKRLHLLSGIAGWGFPATRDERPALKVTATHENGKAEVFELKNGEAFSDYNRVIDVPGSELVEGLVNRGQLRRITLALRQETPLTKLVLESYDNGVTPVVVAVTADIAGAGPQTSSGTPRAAAQEKPAANAGGPKEGSKGDGPLQPAKPVSWEAGKTKVLLIGGGSSHNFAKFFGDADSATLKAAGYSVHYTEDRDQAAAELPHADVAVISVNRNFFDTPAYRKALFDRIAAGKGVVMLHPGTWYGYGKWPELNAQIIGGGARGHDKLGPFQIKVLKPAHPIMAGVPASFDVTDELYYVNAVPAPEGTAPIEILAETSPSQKYNQAHPSVWITQNPKARIVGIALGHDERVHDHAAFKAILANAVKWVAGKK